MALLLYLVPSELIVKIHSLLLQELSLLVYGTDAGVVTAVATAFSQLLQPFSWEGIFVPLLPIAAYEALDAPVPFIVGVVSPSRPTAQISSSAGLAVHRRLHPAPGAVHPQLLRRDHAVQHARDAPRAEQGLLRRRFGSRRQDAHRRAVVEVLRNAVPRGQSARRASPPRPAAVLGPEGAAPVRRGIAVL